MSRFSRRAHREVAQLQAVGLPPYLNSIDTVYEDQAVLIVRAEFVPWRDLTLKGYPTEVAYIWVVWTGKVLAFPAAAGHESWYHRYVVDGEYEELCLWYPDDPVERRWDWSKSFVDFLTLVSRHLQAEEFYRRHQRWPMDDVPHDVIARPRRKRHRSGTRKRAS